MLTSNPALTVHCPELVLKENTMEEVMTRKSKNLLIGRQFCV